MTGAERPYTHTPAYLLRSVCVRRQHLLMDTVSVAK